MDPVEKGADVKTKVAFDPAEISIHMRYKIAIFTKLH
jgi:hypothetical protein